MQRLCKFKSPATIFFSLLVLGAATGCHRSAHSFSIYLTAEPVDRALLASGVGDWSKVRRMPDPIITEVDLLSYDFTQHSMVLSGAAAYRIPNPLLEGTPFILVADGQPVFLGAFVNSLSSIPVGVPSIETRRLGADAPTDSVILNITRGHPASAAPSGADPRQDPRIQRALQGLKKARPPE